MQIVDSWFRDIPQQFLGQPRIEALIEAFSKQLQEIQQVLNDLETCTDLDTATGKNLDMVGTIIPLSRKEAGELAGINVNEPVMSDERYRQYLRFKNLVNTNECTYYDLMEGLALLWEVSPIYYVEDPAMPATIILTSSMFTPGKSVVFGEVPMVKPAGVQIAYEYLIKVVIETIANITCKAYPLWLCGTFRCGEKPRAGSLGKIIATQIDTEVLSNTGIFDTILSGTITAGGGNYGSTEGIVVTEHLETDDVITIATYTSPLTGVILCGTVACE